MAKIKCICNNQIWLGEIPSPHQYMIISDSEYDKFHGQIDSEELYMAMKIVVKCDNCGRLHFFWDGFNKPPIIYLKDSAT